MVKVTAYLGYALIVSVSDEIPSVLGTVQSKTQSALEHS